MEEVARNAGVQLNHVPFKGNADMQQALLGGHVMAQSDATGWDQFVDAGKMRLLVTFGEQRTALARRAHGPGAGLQGRVDLALRPCRPQGMDPAVVRTLHDAFKRALYDPASLEVMQQLNQQPAYRDSQDYREWARATYAKEKDLIEALGLMARTDAPSPCPDWFRIHGLSK